MPENQRIIDSGTYDGVDWRITGDGELVIGNGGEQTFDFEEERGSWCYPWHWYNGQITKARFDGVVHANGSLNGMFRTLASLESLDLSSFDTSKVTDMYWMFRGCSDLTDLNLSSFDTHNVTTMYEMFWGCKSLTDLTVSDHKLADAVMELDGDINISYRPHERGPRR